MQRGAAEGIEVARDHGLDVVGAFLSTFEGYPPRLEAAGFTTGGLRGGIGSVPKPR